MIRHIVLYRLKETTGGRSKAENIAAMKEKLEALVGVVPGLISLTLSPDCNKKDYDVCLDSVFPSLEALAAYRVHPAHVAASDFVHSVISSRAAVDYEF